MNTDAIFKAISDHGAEVRVHNLQLQVRGFDQLPTRLQDAIREQRYELIRRLGLEGCPLATDDDVSDLRRWLDDGTLAWAGRRGVVIVPGWEYNELALVSTARNYLSWMGTGSGNASYRQWIRLVVERVRAMLEEENDHPP